MTQKKKAKSLTWHHKSITKEQKEKNKQVLQDTLEEVLTEHIRNEQSKEDAHFNVSTVDVDALQIENAKLKDQIYDLKSYAHLLKKKVKFLRFAVTNLMESYNTEDHDLKIDLDL